MGLAWGRREMYTKFSRRSEVKDQLERSRYRWENSIKMDIKKIGSEGVS
jgi:hypothetical protein